MGNSEGQDITDASVENVGKYNQTSLMSQANTNNNLLIIEIAFKDPMQF